MLLSRRKPRHTHLSSSHSILKYKPLLPRNFRHRIKCLRAWEPTARGHNRKHFRQPLPPPRPDYRHSQDYRGSIQATCRFSPPPREGYSYPSHTLYSRPKLLNSKSNNRHRRPSTFTTGYLRSRRRTRKRRRVKACMNPRTRKTRRRTCGRNIRTHPRSARPTHHIRVDPAPQGRRPRRLRNSTNSPRPDDERERTRDSGAMRPRAVPTRRSDLRGVNIVIGSRARRKRKAAPIASDKRPWHLRRTLVLRLAQRRGAPRAGRPSGNRRGPRERREWPGVSNICGPFTASVTMTDLYMYSDIIQEHQRSPSTTGGEPRKSLRINDLPQLKL
jgi:hypothetical protein